MMDHRLENEHLFEDLIDSLNMEIQLYEDLHSLLQQKRSAIVEGDVEPLREAIHRENIIIQRIQTVSGQREQQAQVLGAMLNTMGSRPTLSDIIEMAPTSKRQMLSTLRYQLKAIIDHIGMANRENEYLLNSSIDFVRGMIKIFLDSNEEQQGTYENSGELAGKGSNKMIDYQI